MVLYSLVNQLSEYIWLFMSNNLTEHVLFYDKLQEMPFYFPCACVGLYVHVHKVIINVIQAYLLGGV